MKLTYAAVKAYRQFIFSLSAAENPLLLWYYHRLYKPAPGSLAAFISAYSLSKQAGVRFLQIGACDGFVYDPLHKFIKRDNWQGVMLEPQPEVVRNQLSRLYSKREGVRIINAALDRRKGKRMLYTIALSSERWATGLASFNRDILIGKLQSGMLEKHFRRQGIDFTGSPGDAVKGIEVNTITPCEISTLFGDEGIDLLAVDTEGYDYEIIRMLDIDTLSPEIILFEEINLSPEEMTECRSYLASKGYRIITFGKDSVAASASVAINPE